LNTLFSEKAEAGSASITDNPFNQFSGSNSRVPLISFLGILAPPVLVGKARQRSEVGVRGSSRDQKNQRSNNKCLFHHSKFKL
jgi:hypothetical protein